MVGLSIVIVNFNTKKLLKDCVESVVRNTENVKYEIIVVDNASTDGSIETLRRLKTLYPFLKFIRNKKNLGFGAGNNQAIKRAKGDYLLLLNTDTIFSDNVLGEMVSWMEKHPKVGVSTCALKNKDGSLQGSGGYFPNLFKVFAWMFFLEDIPFIDWLIKPFHPMHGQSFFYKGEGYFKKVREQDWVTGAFFLTRARIAEEVGIFDEDYFMYTEEVDWCYRIKQAGWKVWYLPQWSIIHFGGASSAAEFPVIAEFDSIKLFYRKHKTKWQYYTLKFFLKCGTLMRIPLFRILKGKEVSSTYAKAFKTV